MTGPTFEVHQGEWACVSASIISGGVSALSTANVKNCIAFYGGVKGVFCFMFHADFKSRFTKQSQAEFLNALIKHVPAGSVIECTIDGGYQYSFKNQQRYWLKGLIPLLSVLIGNSVQIRSSILELVKRIENEGYTVQLTINPYTNQLEPYEHRKWVKGVAFCTETLQHLDYPSTVQTKRPRPLKAWTIFWGFSNASPDKNG